MKHARFIRGISAAIAAAAIAGCGDDPAAFGAARITRGKQIYDTHCASCHGAKLEGQPNWRQRLPDGKFPAPPHDASGHTWHHPDALLFNITKNGIEPHAPPGHRSDMPAFGQRLPDEDIHAVLAYIKSTWPEETRKRQAEVNRSAGR